MPRPRVRVGCHDPRVVQRGVLAVDGHARLTRIASTEAGVGVEHRKAVHAMPFSMRDQRLADRVARLVGARSRRGDDRDVVELGQGRESDGVGRGGGRRAVVAAGQRKGAPAAIGGCSSGILRIGEQGVEQVAGIDPATQFQRVQGLDLTRLAGRCRRHHGADKARMGSVIPEAVERHARAIGIRGDDGQRNQRGVGQNGSVARDRAAVGHGKPAAGAFEKVGERACGNGPGQRTGRRAVQNMLRRGRHQLACLDAAQRRLLQRGQGAVAAAARKPCDKANPLGLAGAGCSGGSTQVDGRRGAVPVAPGQVDPRHDQARTPLVEKCANGVRHEVERPLVRRRFALQLQVRIPAMDAFEVRPAGQDFRQPFGRRDRPLAGRPDKRGGAGAHAFNGLVAKDRLFDIDTGSQVFRHDAPPCGE